MKIKVLVNIIVIALCLSCISTEQLMTSDNEKSLKRFTVYLKESKKSSPILIENKITKVGNNLKLKSGGYLSIEDKEDSTSNIRVYISNSKNYSDGFSELDKGILAEMATTNGYNIEFNKLKILGLVENGRILKVVSGNDFHFELTLLNWYELVKMPKAPILYRFDGGFSEFSLSKFSPSIGYELGRLNFITRKFEYLALDLLLSASPNDDIDNTYHATIGLDIDFAGWVQAGGAYNFKENDLFFILGVRLEYLLLENLKKWLSNIK